MEAEDPAHAVVWKRNERLVYCTNLSHVILLVMCCGAVFDQFLYELSRAPEPIDTGTPAAQCRSGVAVLHSSIASPGAQAVASHWRSATMSKLVVYYVVFPAFDSPPKIEMECLGDW